GFEIFRGKLNPFTRAVALPGILEILRRTATLASERQAHRAREQADLLITPPVAKYRVTDFDRFDAIVEQGYRHTMLELQALESNPDMMKNPHDAAPAVVPFALSRLILPIVIQPAS